MSENEKVVYGLWMADRSAWFRESQTEVWKSDSVETAQAMVESHDGVLCLVVRRIMPDGTPGERPEG